MRQFLLLAKHVLHIYAMPAHTDQFGINIVKQIRSEYLLELLQTCLNPEK